MTERGRSGLLQRRAVQLATRPRRETAARTTAQGERPPREWRITTGFVVASGFLVVTGLTSLFGLYLLVGSGLAAQRTQDVMFEDLRVQLGQATVPVSGAIPTGTPLGTVEIPGLDLEQVFVEGSASEQTMTAIGLRHDTVLPGQTGASVLVGRRATFGGPFGDLDQVHIGDQIRVTTGQGEFTYVVDLVRTSDAPDTQIEQVASRLTLVTSDPAFAPTRNLTVSARLDGDALPAATGSASVTDDVPGEGSHGRGVALLLWAQLLLLVTGAVTWAAIRLPGRRGLWIGAVPIMLAVLWNVFENVAALLPNTL